MDKSKRTSIVGGAILILVGAVLFAGQIMPDLIPDFWRIFSWPWIIIGVGLGLLVIGAAVGEPGMAVPATIVGGIGAILAYQWYTGDWQSWSYIWALIPGFVGLGIVFMSLLGGDASLKDGANLIFISFTMLAIFGSFFGAVGLAGPYWPVLLILLGVVLVFRTFLKKD